MREGHIVIAEDHDPHDHASPYAVTLLLPVGTVREINIVIVKDNYPCNHATPQTCQFCQ